MQYPLDTPNDPSQHIEMPPAADAPASPERPKRRYLHRVQQGRFDGWRITMAGRKDEYFSIAKYGSEAAAHAAADAALDEILKTRQDTPQVGRANPFGIPGVSLVVTRHPDTGAIRSIGWGAKWWDGQKQRKATFGLLSHGYRDAFWLAVQQRVEWAGPYSGAPLERPPAPPLEVWEWANARGCRDLPEPDRSAPPSSGE